MRARVALHGRSRNDVRVVGRRVYVDFTPADVGRLKPAPTTEGLKPATTTEELKSARPSSDVTPQRADVGAGFSRPEKPASTATEEPTPVPARAATYDAEIEPLVSRLAEIRAVSAVCDEGARPRDPQCARSDTDERARVAARDRGVGASGGVTRTAAGRRGSREAVGRSGFQWGSCGDGAAGDCLVE